MCYFETHQLLPELSKEGTHLVQRRLIRKRLVADFADHWPISGVRLQVSKKLLPLREWLVLSLAPDPSAFVLRLPVRNMVRVEVIHQFACSGLAASHVDPLNALLLPKVRLQPSQRHVFS
jgi:hypothetical protein